MAKVTLLHYTPLDITVRAILTCTGNEDKINNYNAEEFIGKIITEGHLSTLEHINYNFFIEGMSRSVLQELARHRHISLSVQSTRWVLQKFDLESKDVFPNFEEDWQKELNEKYDEILKTIKKLKTEDKIPNDKLKYYLPESISCKLMLTVNARELLHIFELRTSHRALKEFQDLCREIFEVLPEDHKFMYRKYFC